MYRKHREDALFCGILPNLFTFYAIETNRPSLAHLVPLVDVVQQPDYSPEIHFVGKAQLTGIPAHDSLHRQRMLQVERVLVPSPM